METAVLRRLHLTQKQTAPLLSTMAWTWRWIKCCLMNQHRGNARYKYVCKVGYSRGFIKCLFCVGLTVILPGLFHSELCEGGVQMPVAQLWQNPHHYSRHEAPHSHSSLRVSNEQDNYSVCTTGTFSETFSEPIVRAGS